MATNSTTSTSPPNFAGLFSRLRGGAPNAKGAMPMPQDKDLSSAQIQALNAVEKLTDEQVEGLFSHLNKGHLKPSPETAAVIRPIPFRVGSFSGAGNTKSAIAMPMSQSKGQNPVQVRQQALRAVEKLTDEQRAPTQSKSNLIVVKAFAGCGKSTGLFGFAAQRYLDSPNGRGLYLAFNAAIATEAKARLQDVAPNCTARSTHSLAYAAMPDKLRSKHTREFRVKVLQNELGNISARSAFLTLKILEKFWQSDKPAIAESHVDSVDAQYPMLGSERNAALSSAIKAWQGILGGSLSFPDDAYLKMYQLSKPYINVDYILFDEAQDANPVTASIVAQQTHATRVYVGDRHQSIYEFRGALNAMEIMDKQGDSFQLTGTWRFGPKTAGVANQLLRHLKDEPHAIRGLGADKSYTKGGVTILTRTNAEIISRCAQSRGVGMHLVGGAKSYRFGQLLDAYNIYAGQLSEVKDPVLRMFRSWQELQRYGEDTKDAELAGVVKAIETFRHELPQLVADVYRNELPTADSAKRCITTAHRSKGLEWDYVELASDFPEIAGEKFNDQEANLLYVASTRAKLELKPNADLAAWLKAKNEESLIDMTRTGNELLAKPRYA